MLALGVGASGATSDIEQVRSADYSILYIGNSHTFMHDVPGLVGKMIRHCDPKKSVYTHMMGVAFLEDVAKQAPFREEIESRPWKYVVLQAQKISVSGKHEYSRTEGIDFAKLAKGKGAKVLFFCEWGMNGVAGDGARQEKIYQSMANAAEARVARIARAWDLALAERPDLPLHSADGNHQSATGAFLTACVLCGEVTGQSLGTLASFPDDEVSEADRKFLAAIAARVVASK